MPRKDLRRSVDNEEACFCVYISLKKSEKDMLYAAAEAIRVHRHAKKPCVAAAVVESMRLGWRCAREHSYSQTRATASDAQALEDGLNIR